MRLFLAVNLAPAIRAAVHDDAAPVRAAAPGLAWVPPERLHFTLKFLGECDEGAADLLARGMHVVAARHAEFTIDLNEIGAFPNFRRPRVVWAGISSNARLELLQHDVEAYCAELGYEIEGRPFRPHVTLARVRGKLGTEEQRALARAARAVSLCHEDHVMSIDLMQSTLAEQGPRYERVHTAPLGGGAAE